MYGRFPERSDLVDALFEQDLEQMVSRAQNAATDPDARTGLRHSSDGRWSCMRATGGSPRCSPRPVTASSRSRALGRRSRRSSTPWWPGRRTPGCSAPMSRHSDLLLTTTLVAQVGDVDDPGSRERLATLVLDGFPTRRGRPTALSSPAPMERDLCRHLRAAPPLPPDAGPRSTTAPWVEGASHALYGSVSTLRYSLTSVCATRTVSTRPSSWTSNRPPPRHLRGAQQ